MFNIFGFYKFKKLNNLKKLKNRLENFILKEVDKDKLFNFLMEM